MTEKKRACVYTRVSTVEQATSGYSIEEQSRLCRAAIESKEWQFVAEYSDPGVSGRTMEREGLQKMISAIESGEVNAVVIYKLDRLSRKQRDTLTLIEDVIMKHDVALVSLNETLDTSTPWGRAMIGILSSFSQMESETIATRTKMGREAKAAKGGYAGGKPPLGYKSVNGKLVVVPEEAEIIRLVFGLRNRGETYQAIADTLNASGYTTRKGFGFTTSTIQTILGNKDVYSGGYSYGGVGKAKADHEAILGGEV